jgi:hypothetical protein
MTIGSKRYVTVVAYDLQIDNGGNGGKPFASVSLRVVEGEEAGRNLSKRCYLTDAAKAITFEQLRALGWTGTKLSRAMADGLGSTKASAMLVTVERNGKVYEDVNGIYPIRSKYTPVKNPIAQHDLAAFDALFEDDAAAIPASAPTAENAAPATLPPPLKSNGSPKQPTPPANDEYGF